VSRRPPGPPFADPDHSRGPRATSRGAASPRVTILTWGCTVALTTATIYGAYLVGVPSWEPAHRVDLGHRSGRPLALAFGPDGQFLGVTGLDGRV
jgi:hypothetical protein